MTNYSVGNPAPEAFITKNKQRVKQFNGTVYLQDGDNFEIELFNPKSTKVLAKISLDGKRISAAGIVLRPGERVFLERYIDSNNKFMFSTYQVNGDNKQVQQAIKSNGNLKVDFYDVYIPTTWPNQIYYGGTVTTGSPIYYDNTTTISSGEVNGITYTSTSASATLDNAIPTFGGSNMAFYSAEVPVVGDVLRSASATSKSIETGTVEKGESSKQDFEYTYDNFNSYTTKVVEWKILPLSRKPVTTNEMKVFCVNCGTRKRKQSHKFCPNCGTKFE